MIHPWFKNYLNGGGKAIGTPGGGTPVETGVPPDEGGGDARRYSEENCYGWKTKEHNLWRKKKFYKFYQKIYNKYKKFLNIFLSSYSYSLKN